MNDKYQNEKRTRAVKQVCASESSNNQRFSCLSNEIVHMSNDNTRTYSKSQ